jgi:hypothetical protein
MIGGPGLRVVAVGRLVFGFSPMTIVLPLSFPSRMRQPTDFLLVYENLLFVTVEQFRENRFPTLKGRRMTAPICTLADIDAQCPRPKFETSIRGGNALEDRDAWVTRRAYEIWEQAGRPDGADHAHWQQALEEWNAQTQKNFTDAAEWDDEEEEW